MEPDVRGQDVGDGGVITVRVLHDALKGVDAAQAYIHLLRSEVSHRRGVPVGDLSFLDERPVRSGLGVGLCGLDVGVPQAGHCDEGGKQHRGQLDPAGPVQTLRRRVMPGKPTGRGAPYRRTPTNAASEAA